MFRDSQNSDCRVAVYTRYSSSLQRSSSTADQLRQCRETASARGWRVLDKYIRSDEAKSGRGRVGRDGFEELIALAQTRDCPFNGILIDDTSRFGRNLSQTLPLSDLLEEAGIFLHFANRSLDSRDPNFRQLFIAYGQHDEAFSRSLGEKVHRGQRGRALNGYIPNGRVYGYTNVPIEHPTRKGLYGRPYVEAVKLEINPQEAAVVIRIFELYRDGLGHRGIAGLLNHEGVPSPLRGISECRRFWNTPLVAKVLKNLKYRGVHIWNRTRTSRSALTQLKVQRTRPESEWERIEVPEWRIVSEELWNSVWRENRKRQGNAARRKGGLNRTEKSRGYVFSGLLRCAECAGKVNVIAGVGDKARYGCSRHRFEGTCTNATTVKRSVLETTLLEAFARNLLSAQLRDHLYAAVKAEITRQWSQRQIEELRGSSGKPAIRRRLEQLAQQAENLVNAIASGFDPKLLEGRLNQIDTEVTGLKKQLSSMSDIKSGWPILTNLDDFLAQESRDLPSKLIRFPERAKKHLADSVGNLSLRPIRNGATTSL